MPVVGMQDGAGPVGVGQTAAQTVVAAAAEHGQIVEAVEVEPEGAAVALQETVVQQIVLDVAVVAAVQIAPDELAAVDEQAAFVAVLDVEEDSLDAGEGEEDIDLVNWVWVLRDEIAATERRVVADIAHDVAVVEHHVGGIAEAEIVLLLPAALLVEEFLVSEEIRDDLVGIEPVDQEIVGIVDAAGVAAAVESAGAGSEAVLEVEIAVAGVDTEVESEVVAAAAVAAAAGLLWATAASAARAAAATAAAARICSSSKHWRPWTPSSC